MNQGKASANTDRFDVFVSYRRKGGAELARLLYEELSRRGFRVFLDTDTLAAGSWSEQLKQRIDECPDFIAVITDGFFDRCGDVDDVVRKEIARALAHRKNVVPLLASGTPFPESLPADIAALPAHNGVRYVHEYSQQAVEKLCNQLISTPLVGPERLLSPEAQPKVIVGLVCMYVGGYVGRWNGNFAGTSTNVLMALGNGLIIGTAWAIILGIPILVSLAVLSHVLQVRRDRLYVGPWVPFWLLIWHLAAAAGGVATLAAHVLLGGSSDFLDGFAGGLAGLGVAGLFCYTRAWSILEAAFKGRVRS